MATILTQPVKYAGSVWSGGMSAGVKAGLSQGFLRMLGFHQLFARTGGALIASAFMKNADEKRITLVEGTKEGIYQLMAGE